MPDVWRADSIGRRSAAREASSEREAANVAAAGRLGVFAVSPCSRIFVSSTPRSYPQSGGAVSFLPWSIGCPPLSCTTPRFSL
jgi:hypothetical protein